MTTTLGEIVNDLFIRSGKDFRGGFITPYKLNNGGLRTVNQRKMNQLVDFFEKNQEVTSDLQPFIKTLGSPQYPALAFTPVLASNPAQGGYADIPEDFWYEARSSYKRIVTNGCDADYQYRTVNFVSQHEFDAIMYNSITNPTVDLLNNDPVMIIQNDKFFVYPYIRRINFTYIKEPRTPYFDYDIISGMPVYLPPGDVHVNDSVLPAGTPSLSVEFEYPESCVDSLTDMLKTYFGIGNESKWNIETQIPMKNQ